MKGFLVLNSLRACSTKLVTYYIVHSIHTSCEAAAIVMV